MLALQFPALRSFWCVKRKMEHGYLKSKDERERVVLIKALLIARTYQSSAEASYSMVNSSLAWISTILNSVSTKERLREAYLPCDLRDLPVLCACKKGEGQVE